MESGEVSAEVHFAQKLASNEKKIRDRAIKRLQKYLSVRSRHGAGLSDSDLLKIWKGLFYCMWMQDKPLIQEELSQRITSLLHCFPKTKDALQFLKVSLETHAREWNGIDRLRLDKFLMMVRDLLHKTFELLSKDGWQMDDCQDLSILIKEDVMDPDKPKLPDGLKLHLSDIYVEEMQRVSLSQMTSKKLVVLLRPFIDFIVYSSKTDLVRRVMSDVIEKVINTMSAAYQVSIKESSQTPRKVESESDDDDESMEMGSSEYENGKDNKDVEMEQHVQIDLGLLLMVMFKLAGRKNVCGPNRKMIYKLVSKQQETYDSAVNMLNSAKSSSASLHDDANEADTERNESISDKDLTFLLDDGKAMDQQRLGTSLKKKRRKIKKFKLESQQSVEKCLPVKKDEHGKNRERKRKLSEKNSLNICESDSAKSVDQAEIDEFSPLAKRLKLSSSLQENELDSVIVSNKSQERKKSGRRKRESAILGFSKGESILQITSENTNGNARSKSRSVSPSNQSPVTAPVELVVYQPKPATELHSQKTSIGMKGKKSSQSSSPLRHKKAKSLLVEDMDIVTPSEYTEDMDTGEYSNDTSKVSARNIKSMKTDGDTSVSSSVPSSPSVKSKKKAESQHSEKQTIMESADASSNIVQELCSALAGPCNIMKKAIAMVTPQPSPGSFTDIDRKRACSAELTPGTKKKVIFDLRRNKANKFQDYLKSIAQQPDSPHTPTKSPSASILKSPAPSPALCTDNSDSAVEDSVSSESMSSASSKQTKNLSHSKRKASAHNSRGKDRSPHRKGKSKRSSSPRRAQSYSPAPASGKQKSKQRGRAHK